MTVRDGKGVGDSTGWEGGRGQYGTGRGRGQNVMGRGRGQYGTGMGVGQYDMGRGRGQYGTGRG